MPIFSRSFSSGLSQRPRRPSPVLVLFRSLQAALRARAAEAELAGLDERTLHDLGLSSCDIPRVARSGRDPVLGLGGCDR